MEYVIEAKDADDMKSWLSAIRSSVTALPFLDNADDVVQNGVDVQLRSTRSDVASSTLPSRGRISVFRAAMFD